MKPCDYLNARHADQWNLITWWRFFNQSRFGNLSRDEVKRMTRGVMRSRVQA